MFFTAHLRELEDIGFGRFLEKRKHPKLRRDAIFLKPHPSTVVATHRVLRSGRKSLDQYTAAFSDWTNVIELEEAILRKYHPHIEIMEVFMSQRSSGGSSTSGGSTGGQSSAGTTSSQTSADTESTTTTPATTPSGPLSRQSSVDSAASISVSESVQESTDDASTFVLSTDDDPMSLPSSGMSTASTQAQRITQLEAELAAARAQNREDAV